MFLTSDAFRVHGAGLAGGEWPAATVLLVSHQWNPDRDGAEALAGRRLARCLLDAGARVHVLAASRAETEIEHPRYGVDVSAPRRVFAGRVGCTLQMLRSTVPEMAGQWIAGAVTTGLQALSRLPADTIIYGRSSPGASNVAAWLLAQRTGLPFVAHFSDAWPPPQLMARGRRWLAPHKWPLFQLWRRRILRDAGALTFTNPGEARLFLREDAERYAGKAFVVAHLPTMERPRPLPAQYDCFHLVHAGNFYPPGHTAATLIQGIRRFLDATPAARGLLRVTHAGWSHGDLPYWTERCRLEHVVRVVGRLPQADVFRLMDSASLLLAVDYARPDSTTVLSKLPDYVNAERPLLALTSPDASLGRVFLEGGAGLIAKYDSPEQVAARIATVFDAWQRQRLDALLPRPSAREAFGPVRVLGELGAAFALARRHTASALAECG